MEIDEPTPSGPYQATPAAGDAAARRVAAKEKKKMYKELAKQRLQEGGDPKGDPKKTGLPSGYVDRAKERIKQATEYEKAEEQFKHMTANESKYLGGDLDHTHWVKGLDEALLARRREEVGKDLFVEDASSVGAVPAGR